MGFGLGGGLAGGHLLGSLRRESRDGREAPEAQAGYRESSDPPHYTRTLGGVLWAEPGHRKQELLRKASARPKLSVSRWSDIAWLGSRPQTRGRDGHMLPGTAVPISSWGAAGGWLSTMGCLVSHLPTQPPVLFICTSSPGCISVFVCLFFLKKRTRSLLLSQGILKTPAKAITRS